MDSCVVIGAGAAGLFFAARLGESGAGAKCVVLDSNPGPGRKLLLSGAGQCNYTHGGPVGELLSRYGGKEQSRFLRKALHAFSNENLIGYFRDRGLPSLVREDGKVFPSSLRAADVVRVLAAAARDVSFRYGEQVTGVSLEEDAAFPGTRFHVRTVAGSFRARYLLIAAGGLSYPGTGSRGDGFSFARMLGHSVTALRPALAPLHVKDYPLAELAGVSLASVPVSLWKAGKKTVTETGDLVFTHSGISGPAALHLSRFVDPGDVVTLDLTRSPNPEPFLESFPAVLRADPAAALRDPVRKLVRGSDGEAAVPKRLLSSVFEGVGLTGDERCGNLSKDAMRRLGKALTAFPLTVEKTGGYPTAMATAGGVALAEVDSGTMESRIVPGLFFAGEMLDIDGDSGGYNIQAAFSTAFLAARAISSRLS